ncbi:energy-coupling factor transporter ATPase [Clostridia bacterium]|nr:energy-coupling factor transporter ATPase [Clostridia bacterium]
MIKIENVIHTYKKQTDDEVQALAGISLTIHEGEFLVIIGHNGSGKSTLAKHLNSLLIPSEGQVYIDGLSSTEPDNIWNIRSKVGMVFQNPDNQLIATTVEDDVAFGCENLGIESGEIRKRVDDALETVGMAGFGTKEPHYLSGGQKQRVAIAGVIAMRPKYLVLDEPTAMLDPRGRKEVMETIQRLNKDEGLTIVHITHYMEEASHADRVVVMENGRIVTQGTPREIFSQVQLLKSLRMDVPPMTELASRLNDAGVEVDRTILTVDEMVDAIC